MYLTDFTEKAFLNTLNNIKMIAPQDVYLGLFLNDPTDTGAGGIEISYSGYERQKVVFSEPTLQANTVAMHNMALISFSKSDREVGTVQYVGFFNSKNGGNMLAYGKLTEELAIGIDEAPTILDKEIVFSLSLDLSQAYKTKLLNYFRGQSIEGFAPHMALYNGSPDRGGSEITGSLYERVALSFTTPSDEPTGYSAIKLNADAKFNKPPDDWGVFNHFVIYDDAMNGEPVFIKQRSVERRLLKGHTVIFEVDSVVVAIN